MEIRHCFCSLSVRYNTTSLQKEHLLVVHNNSNLQLAQRMRGKGMSQACCD